MNLRNQTTLALLAFMSPMVALPAYAQDSLTFGTDIELETSSDNSTLTATPYLEYSSASGAYVGADISNVDSDDDDYAVSAYVGYAGEVGVISYDFYYGHYYLNETGDDGQEASVTIGYPIFGNLSMDTEFTSDLDSTESIAQTATYALPSGYEASGTYEFSELDDADSWEIGLSKTVNDEVSLDWRYYDAEDSDPSVGMTVSFATDVAGWFN